MWTFRLLEVNPMPDVVRQVRLRQKANDVFSKTQFTLSRFNRKARELDGFHCAMGTKAKAAANGTPKHV